MAKYLSQLNRKLQIGISSYTEDSTVFNVVGKVGIKTTSAQTDFDVHGDSLISGTLSVDTQIRSADVFVSGISSFKNNVAIGETSFVPTRNLDVGGDALFRENIEITNSVSAGEYNGPLRFGKPEGGFKPGAIGIDTSDFTKNSINDINFILGKLVPKPPATIEDAEFSLLNLGSGYLCDGFTPTNNTLGDYTVNAGISYPRNTTNNVTSSWLTEYGPGDQGTVYAMVNFNSLGFREMTSNDLINPDNTITNDYFSDDGTYQALQIANDKDAFFSSRNTGIASDFYEVYDSRVLNASAYQKGFNMAYIKQQVGANIYLSEKFLWYEDPSTVSAPSLIVTTPVSPSSPDIRYSSGIPHYTQSTANNFEYQITCINSTGDMYSNYTFLTSGGTTSGFQNPGNKNYGHFGGSNPPVRNYGVGAGVTATILQRPVDNHIRVTTNTQKFSSYTATTPYGTDAIRASISQFVNIMGTTPRTNLIDEDYILAFGSGNNARRVESGSSGDNPTPTYVSWPSDITVYSLNSYEAVVVGGDLKHDQTNYSTGYLPVGPDYSTGRSGSQYFQLEIIQSQISEFRISINGTYSGCWVCMPDNSVWRTGDGGDKSIGLTATNGWANMFQSYRGSGVPDDTGNGCAFAGNMTGSSGTFTCVFGTESTSNDSNNRILIRFKLNSGNQINTLSFSNT